MRQTLEEGESDDFHLFCRQILYQFRQTIGIQTFGSGFTLKEMTLACDFLGIEFHFVKTLTPQLVYSQVSRDAEDPDRGTALLLS